MASTFKSLLSDGSCQMEVLSSIGQKLRQQYDEHLADAMPDRLSDLLKRLESAEHGG